QVNEGDEESDDVHRDDNPPSADDVLYEADSRGEFGGAARWRTAGHGGGACARTGISRGCVVAHCGFSRRGCAAKSTRNASATKDRIVVRPVAIFSSCSGTY